MYRWAELKYGKVHSIFETEMNKAEMASAFIPTTVWVDVTDLPQVKEGWIYDGAIFVAPTKHDEERTVEEAASAQWDKIKIARDNEEQSGCPYMESMIDSDTISVQRIAIAVQNAQVALSAGEDFSVNWTMQDNNVITMSAVDVIGMSIALARFSNTLHQKARGLREKIKEIVDKYNNGEFSEEVAKNKISSVGW